VEAKSFKFGELRFQNWNQPPVSTILDLPLVTVTVVLVFTLLPQMVLSIKPSLELAQTTLAQRTRQTTGCY